MYAFDKDDFYLGDYTNNSTKTNIKENNCLKVSEIFSNKENIKIIREYLKDLKKSNGIVLRGYVGCGKMEIIKACLNETEYDYIIYDTETDSEDICGNIIKCICSTKGIDKLFNMKRSAIILKDIDDSLKTVHRKQLYSFLTKAKHIDIPIFITSNDNSVGAVRDVPKRILQLKFERPFIHDLMNYFSYSKINENKLKDIIIRSNYDLRHIKTLLEGSENMIECYKHIELDTFNSIEYCFNDHNLQDKLNYCSIYSDNTLFQNYIKMMNKTKDLKQLYEISDSCTLCDVLTSYMFENCVWDTYDDAAHSLGTILPTSIIKRYSNEKIPNLIKKLEYPSSNLHNLDQSNNINISSDPIYIKILLYTYFPNGKFNNDYKNFEKDIFQIKNPLQAFKLCSGSDKKLLNEFKKVIKKISTTD